jgi:hypothetical protein
MERLPEDIDLELPELRGSSQTEVHRIQFEQALQLETTLLNEISLPPADSGPAAWYFLLSAFILEAFVWGFAFTFGIFQDYYVTHELFRESASSIATIGTAQSGVMYIGMLPMFYSLLKFPSFKLWSLPCGMIIMCISLAASSFATNVPTLIATQGVLYGIGGSLAYCPSLLWLEEWFSRRLGLAFGIMWVSLIWSFNIKTYH